MKSQPCDGTGQPTVPSEYRTGAAMCPVCTKYLRVANIGHKAPRHTPARGYLHVARTGYWSAVEDDTLSE